MAKAPAGFKVYVGCALTHAPEEFKLLVQTFKESLIDNGIGVLDFLDLHTGDPAKVYRHDILYCVKNCDAFIAVCDYPAIGLGYELNEATRLKKPVLAVAHKDTLLTRLVPGAAKVEPNVSVLRYKNLIKDVTPKVLELKTTFQ